MKADRIEDFGLRVRSAPYLGSELNLATMWFAKFAQLITAVVPNTAATKAGLQPGERILRFDGKSTVAGPFRRANSANGARARRKNSPTSPRHRPPFRVVVMHHPNWAPMLESDQRAAWNDWANAAKTDLVVAGHTQR